MPWRALVLVSISTAPGMDGVAPANRVPNKRLKLAAPGLGRNCVCAPARFVVLSMHVARGSAGAAA